MTINQLCTSTLNVKKLLEKGLLDELINLVLLGGDDNIKKEAVACLSKVSMFLLSFPSSDLMFCYLIEASLLYPSLFERGPAYTSAAHESTGLKAEFSASHLGEAGRNQDSWKTIDSNHFQQINSFDIRRKMQVIQNDRSTAMFASRARPLSHPCIKQAWV